MSIVEKAALPARKSRRLLWLLLLVFFAPLATSFLLYYAGDGWRPAGSTNKGDLVAPARVLPEVALLTPAGTRTAGDFLRGKWSLVYVGAGSCDERCREALTDMRQVRLALNQDSSRVQRIFLYSGNCCDRSYFEQEHAGLVTATIDNAEGQALLTLFPAYDDIPALTAGRLYLVDPLGNLMMSYATDAPPRGLLDDLDKLLKLSHIG